MGHHSGQPFDEEMDNLRKLNLQNLSEVSPDLLSRLHNLGSTGNFPDGKLTENDEGEIAIGITEKDGRVIIAFGKPIEWIGFTAEEVKDLGKLLIQKANTIIAERFVDKHNDSAGIGA